MQRWHFKCSGAFGDRSTGVAHGVLVQRVVDAALEAGRVERVAELRLRLHLERLDEVAHGHLEVRGLALAEPPLQHDRGLRLAV